MKGISNIELNKIYNEDDVNHLKKKGISNLCISHLLLAFNVNQLKKSVSNNSKLTILVDGM